MNYFACQFKTQNGYKLSILKILPEIEIHLLKPLQWRKIDIKNEEYEFINNSWNKFVKPQYNWTIEQWIEVLNKQIKIYRNKLNKQKIEIIKPIEINNPSTIKIVNNAIYDLIIDKSNPLYKIKEEFLIETKNYMNDKLKELTNKYNLKCEIEIGGNFEIYFDLL